MAQEFTVLDMTCQGCAATVRNVVSRIPGVDSVDVDLPTHNVRVNALAEVPAEKIVTALNKAGYSEITARRSGGEASQSAPATSVAGSCCR